MGASGQCFHVGRRQLLDFTNSDTRFCIPAEVDFDFLRYPSSKQVPSRALESWGGGACPDLPFDFEHLDQSTCAAVS